jgi:cbb3-type cytochrome oxidase subunit 3
MPREAAIIVAVDLGLAAVIAISIGIQWWKFRQQRRHAAKEQ